MPKKMRGLFDEQDKMDRISKLGDPLERLNQSIEWSLFRPLLNGVFAKEAKGPGGRPGFDYVMMFKILILQEYFGLSDEQLEFQITDRFSFMRFLGLGVYNKVPDSNTIWNFREQLSKEDSVKKLFAIFHKELTKQGMIINKGKIVDASIIDAPIQRNSKEENKELKDAKIPAAWQDNLQKLSHKDIDAKWVTKNGEDRFGYKNSIKVDSKKKFIDNYNVTDAATHDSVSVKPVLSKKDKGQPLYGDSAFSRGVFEDAVNKCGMINKVHEKGYRNNPLTEKQKQSNNRKSKIRARVEHIFGHLHQRVGKPIIRTIGMVRARVKIGLMNLTYNLCRFTYYKRSFTKTKCALN